MVPQTRSINLSLLVGALGDRVRHLRHGPWVAVIGRFIPTLRREGQTQLLLRWAGFLPSTVREFSGS